MRITWSHNALQNTTAGVSLLADACSLTQNSALLRSALGPELTSRREQRQTYDRNEDDCCKDALPSVLHNLPILPNSHADRLTNANPNILNLTSRIKSTTFRSVQRALPGSRLGPPNPQLIESYQGDQRASMYLIMVQICAHLISMSHLLLGLGLQFQMVVVHLLSPMH